MGLGIAGTAYELQDKPPNATSTDMFEAICGPMPWATQFLVCESSLNESDGGTAGLQVFVDLFGDLDLSDFPGAAPQPAFAG